MPRKHLTLAALATVAVFGLAACSSDTASPSSVSDASLAADLAASSGDAVATDVSDMVGNEQYSGVSADVAPAFATATDSTDLSRVRTRTCYDANGGVVTCGQGLTASAVVTLQVDGYRATSGFTGMIHRQRHDSISGIGNGSTSRTHNGYGASQDTTTYTRDVTTRVAQIAASDSVIDLVFNLPHANNPWPVSGQVIRNVDATFSVTGGATDRTRTIQRRVVVTFPADGEGNVPIQVGTLTCTLNLVTHAVTGCTGS